MKELTQQRFGLLTAIRRTDRKHQESWLWFCQCDCGNTCEVSAHDLLSGRKRSCGCLAISNLTGRRFGRLTVLKSTGRKDEKTRCYLWLCQCDCGKQVEVPVVSLTHGINRSCGCMVHQNKGLEPGQKRGTVTAVGPVRLDDKGRTIWQWRCDCGNTFEKTTGAWWSQENVMCTECIGRERSKSAKRMTEKTARYEPTGAALGAVDNIRGGKLTRNNTSGIRGVCWNKAAKKWMAYILVNKRQKVLGYFDDKEEAGRVRAAAVKEIYGERN